MAIFETAMAELAVTMKAEAAIDIVYHRGADSVALIKKAWTGRTPFRVLDNGRSRLIWSEKDFLIPVVDLVLNGVPITPELGDWISVSFNGDVQTFQPWSPKDEPFYRFSDPQRTIYRIHTKRKVIV